MTQPLGGAPFEPVRDPSFALYQEEGAELETVGQHVLPLRFADPAAEERAAREAAALATRPYLGRLVATGADVLDLLERISSNSVLELAEGQGVPTALLTDKGRVLDALYLFRLPGRCLLLTTRDMSVPVREWIDRFTIVEDVTTEDITGQTRLLTLLGPQAPQVLGDVLGVADLPLYGAAETLLDTAQVVVLRTDPFGLLGYDLVVEEQGARNLWRRLQDAGAQPVGEATLEALRVTAGWPGRDAELSQDYNPLEAGLGGMVTFRKCYIGQEVVARLNTYKKLQRHLVRLELERADTAPGATLLHEGKEVGRITSVAPTASTGTVAALGYVRPEAAAKGTDLAVASGGSARVLGLALPFGPGED